MFRAKLFELIYIDRLERLERISCYTNDFKQIFV
jgi:hypothetical protein